MVRDRSVIFSKSKIRVLINNGIGNKEHKDCFPLGFCSLKEYSVMKMRN
jgi:hypothetical protein